MRMLKIYRIFFQWLLVVVGPSDLPIMINHYSCHLCRHKFSFSCSLISNVLNWSCAFKKMSVNCVMVFFYFILGQVGDFSTLKMHKD